MVDERNKQKGCSYTKAGLKMKNRQKKNVQVATRHTRGSTRRVECSKKELHIIAMKLDEAMSKPTLMVYSWVRSCALTLPLAVSAELWMLEVRGRRERSGSTALKM